MSTRIERSTTIAADRAIAGREDPAAPVAGTAERLADFLAARTRDLDALDPRIAALGQELMRLTMAGGKRLRPAFVYWGARAAGASDLDAAVTVGAAVELVHTFALIHDDVMDASVVRRGQPTVHVALADDHQVARRRGDGPRFGVSGAILAGDLALTWSDELLEKAALPPDRHADVRRRFHHLRAEVIAGQFLELRLAGEAELSPADALRVALLKSGRYTVTRPLQVGAATVAADGPWCDPLARYGDATGVAFQLRDDVLGLFGDPALTAKSASDDVRDHRHTTLLVAAHRCASPAGRRWLRARIGAPEFDDGDLDALRDLVRDSGALDVVDGWMRAEVERARDAVTALPVDVRPALLGLLELATERDR